MKKYAGLFTTVVVMTIVIVLIAGTTHADWKNEQKRVRVAQLTAETAGYTEVSIYPEQTTCPKSTHGYFFKSKEKRGVVCMGNTYQVPFVFKEGVVY